MKNTPNAAALLAIARETLAELIVPKLAGPDRYQALMIANAMAIAEREVAALEADGEAEQSELALLEELYGDSLADAANAPGSPGSDESRLWQLNRQLARDLRSGDLDGACEPGVRAILRAQVEARLSLSNPQYLQASRDG